MVQVGYLILSFTTIRVKGGKVYGTLQQWNDPHHHSSNGRGGEMDGC
jgi:hypothetical protein